MSLIANEIASGLSNINNSPHQITHSINCSLHQRHTDSQRPATPAECSLIQCHDNTSNRNFTFELMPCATPPALRVVQNDSLGFVVDAKLTESEAVALNLNGDIFLFLKINQLSDRLSLGLAVNI